MEVISRFYPPNLLFTGVLHVISGPLFYKCTKFVYIHLATTVQGGPGQGARRHLLGAERLGLLETGEFLAKPDLI